MEPVRSLLEMRRDNVVVQEWDLSCGAAAAAGGSGASQLNSAASAVDVGDGANGIVIVWEYLK